MCIAVGKVSLDDWLRLTWSFGCTGALAPSGAPSSSFARFAITSLAFMLLWVPEPVCQTTSGKCSCKRAVRHLLGGARDRVGEARLQVPLLAVDHARPPA